MDRQVTTEQEIAPNMGDQGYAAAFLSYNVGCIALQKLTYEIQKYWVKDKLPYVIFSQDQYEKILPIGFKTLVLHRGGTHQWHDKDTDKFLMMLRDKKDRGERVVYYIDDFLMHLNNNLPIHIMKMCDMVVAKGYFLPKYLRESEGLTNVESLKTWIDLERFDDPDHPPIKMTKPFNIVWFSAGLTGLGYLPKVLEELEKNSSVWDDTEFHNIGTGAAVIRSELNKFRKLNKSYAEKVDLEGLYQIVKAADIVINPLSMESDNEELCKLPTHRKFFNDSKVEIKYIISGAAKKPLVTSVSEAYKQCIDQGKNGYMTDDPKEWAEILTNLKKDKALRTRIGKKARKEVEAEYDIVHRWDRIKKLLLGTQPLEADSSSESSPTE